jgi:hypothetical protein
VSRVGLGFRLTQNLGFLEKEGASLFHYFWGLNFDSCSSVVSPLVSLCRIFLSEEVWDVSRVGLGFRLTQNLGFRKKVRCEPFHYFWVLDFDGTLRSCPPCPCANILSEEVW